MLYKVEVLKKRSWEMSVDIDMLPDPTKQQVVDKLVGMGFPYDESVHVLDYYPAVRPELIKRSVYTNDDMVSFGNYMVFKASMSLKHEGIEIKNVDESRIYEWKRIMGLSDSEIKETKLGLQSVGVPHEAGLLS